MRIEVLEHGGPDGVGLLRRGRVSGGVMLLERIVDLKPDEEFDYRIENSRPGFDDRFGRITFDKSNVERKPRGISGPVTRRS